MNRSGDARRPFASFLRRYTKTWVHALATAGLTAFGMLTFLHWGFAVVAIGVYLSAPVVLYVTDAGVIPSDGDEESRTETTSDDRTDSRSAGPDDERQRTSETGVTETGTATGTRTPDSAASNHGDDETSDRASEGDTVDSAEEGDTPDSAEEGDTPDSADERDSVEPADERDSVEPADEWTAADAPTDADLADAAVVPGGAYAVGAGGVVLGTADASAGESSDGPSSGANWRVVLEDGPSADANDLAGVAATADGEAVWVVGDGGALGRLEAATDRHVDHSSSLDATDSWTDVAVIGPSGEETLLLVNGSGEVRRGRYRDGELAWSSPTKPGSGSSFAAAAAGASGSYLCDTNDGVFEGDGEEFRCVGVDGADGTLEDVAATAPGDCGVVDDAGTYHRYDGTNWTPVSLASDPLRGLAASSAADRRVAVGDEGRLFERSRESGGWERRDVPATVSLRGVALDDGDGDRSDPDDGASTPPPPRRGVAVGEDGTLLERGL